MKRIGWLLAALVAGMLTLAGCTTPSANVAATVNGKQIPVASIEGPVAVIGGTTDQANALADAHATVLSYAIRGEIARGIAAEQNIQLTGDPRSSILTANANLAKYADDPTVGGFVTDVVDSTIVINNIGEAAFLAKVAASDVQVNPRYGAWSIATAAVNQSGGQLSQPWVTPTAPA